MSREQMQANLTNQLNVLQAAGINAVMFQVRPEADALYRSSYEPWSRWLTGRQGQDPGWDPLEWMVRECHRRGMELHAWINPFRAKTKDTKELAANHPYWLKPDRFFSYDGLIISTRGKSKTNATSVMWRPTLCAVTMSTVCTSTTIFIPILYPVCPFPTMPPSPPTAMDSTTARIGVATT